MSNKINSKMRRWDFIPLSVNWHITKKCNYNCKFCFAKFNDVNGMLSLDKAIKIPRILSELGCKKINFAGGEPLLYPYLDTLIKESYDCGLKTSIVTNGFYLSEEKIKILAPYLDWLGLSLDSCNEYTQMALGRGNGDHIKRILEIVEKIKDHNIKLKINTVVTSLNQHDDMRSLIKRIDPDRWKVFQVMKVGGENELSVTPFLITLKEFNYYCQRNDIVLKNGNNTVFETSEDMKGSYIMIDPLGRYFHNITGEVRYMSMEISDYYESTRSLPFDNYKFILRGGIYEW
jgi:radical S-adenosyl methionine domain-containing protein 2